MKTSTFFVKTLDFSTKKKYDKAVLNFIVADGRPFESAAGIGFKNLCSVFTNGSYNPPHPTTLSRRLDDMVNTLHEQFGANLRSDMATSKPSITFDHWKADKEIPESTKFPPFLSKLRMKAARNLLAIQATNCSSGRVNSVGGQIITDYRHNFSVKIMLKL
ncbi:hypothetical protein HELRODRAFT_163016 [Helobdella robusta]|uniref:Uncharacterized protein n=1 Tax=Helobdella robusta TaxID=6412 RepID=T1ETK4_HELRO|nr:hypothetical protein HELRODRAFT_163016 [Helobdella robusta]ESN99466.1 hypothetical protein HELRODRAFT_163016 [Helobdella robusta]